MKSPFESDQYHYQVSQPSIFKRGTSLATLVLWLMDALPAALAGVMFYPLCRLYEVEFDAGSDAKRFVGENDGYARLEDPLEPLERVEIHRGGTADQGGWISRRFGLKVPGSTVLWHSSVAGVTVLRMRITYTRSRSFGL